MFKMHNLLTLFAVCLFTSGCATGNAAPNPLTAQLRQQLVLQSVIVTSTSNASAGSDATTLAAVKPKLKAKLAKSLAAGMKGTRPAQVKVEITRLTVDQRILSVTPISTATVRVLDAKTGETLASYRAGHEEPLGRATMAVISTDDFIANGLSASVTKHVLSNKVHVDRAVPNAAGGILGEIL